MLFFTYDLEHYRDDLRGFYFDLAEIAPGPARAHQRGTRRGDRRHRRGHRRGTADRYARFQDTFCSLEDGHATERVLDLLFPPGDSAGARHHGKGMNVRTSDRALTSSPRDLARTAAPRPLHPRVQAVILAAGMGTRLGRATPKPLTRLQDGRTILSPSARRAALGLRRGHRHHRRRRLPQRAAHGGGARPAASPTTRTSRPRTPRRACCARSRNERDRRRAVAQRRRRLRPRRPRARAAWVCAPTRASSASTPPRSPTKRSSTPSTATATSGSCRRPSSAGSARPWASTTCPAADKAALIEHLAACGDRTTSSAASRPRSSSTACASAARHLRVLRGGGRLRERSRARQHAVLGSVARPAAGGRGRLTIRPGSARRPGRRPSARGAASRKRRTATIRRDQARAERDQQGDGARAAGSGPADSTFADQSTSTSGSPCTSSSQPRTTASSPVIAPHRAGAAEPETATSAAVSAGSIAARIAPTCEATLTGGSGVAAACHSAAAAPTSSSTPSGRAVRASRPAATASRPAPRRAATPATGTAAGSRSAPGHLHRRVPVHDRHRPLEDGVCAAGSAATTGGSRFSLIQCVRWSCQT